MLIGLFSDQSLAANCPELLDFSVRKLNQQESVNLCEAYGGDVLLVVNTASKCAFTGQYEGLEALHERYQNQGFSVLGFPSGDFGGQEFRDEQGIADFCRTTYGVGFPMFEKSHVKGSAASPFWKQLVSASGTSPKWNFYKYLIGRDGRVINSYASFTGPDSKTIIADIEEALAQDRSVHQSLKRLSN